MELLLSAPLETGAQHLENLRLWPAVDEDDKPEAELLLVDLVEVGELGQHDRVGIGSLLHGRALREVARADRRVRVQRLELLGLVQPGDHLGRGLERVVALRQQLDEARPALEELGELLDAQLPR